MRFVLSLILAILALGSFGFQAQASGPIPSEETMTPDSNSLPTMRSKLSEQQFTDPFPLAIAFTGDTPELIVARLVNTAKPGLTPRYNKINLAKFNPRDGERIIRELPTYSPWIQLTSVISAGDYIVVTGKWVDFAGDGFLVYKTKDGADPTVSVTNPKLVQPVAVAGNSRVGLMSDITAVHMSGNRIITALNYYQDGLYAGSEIRSFEIIGTQIKEGWRNGLNHEVHDLLEIVETRDLLAVMFDPKLHDYVQAYVILSPRLGSVPLVVYR